MKVKLVMTTELRACRLETNLAEAVQMMWDADCGVLPVVTDEGRVFGVITDRDIAIAVGTRDRPAGRIAVREVVSAGAHTCLAEDSVASALATMKAHRVRRLPVVDADGHLRGMVSLNDVVTHPGAATAGEVMGALSSICGHRPTGGVVGSA